MFFERRFDFPVSWGEGPPRRPKWNYDSSVYTAALVVTRPIENTGNVEIQKSALTSGYCVRRQSRN